MDMVPAATRNPLPVGLTYWKILGSYYYGTQVLARISGYAMTGC
jgi:hypothetical protein